MSKIHETAVLINETTKYRAASSRLWLISSFWVFQRRGDIFASVRDFFASQLMRPQRKFKFTVAIRGK